MSSTHPLPALAAIEDRFPVRRRPDSATRPFAVRDERPEIEGLRGVAILSLLAIHCAPGLSRGGAIGVDLFFVVSGYLLTRSLWRQDRDRGAWREFLTRRLQRAVPPLVVVLAACLVFGTLFTLPDDLKALGSSMSWGAALLTNVDAWRRDVPIDAARTLDPLAHLWQVAAIVQCGALLALLSWMIQPQRRTMLRFAVVTGAMSFAFCVLTVEQSSGAAFYLLAGRWWELMVGVGLALGLRWASLEDEGASGERAAASRRAITVWPRAEPILGWVGVACYAVAVLLAGSTAHFPGWWAVWPVAGTACLLAAGPQATINRLVLAQPMLRFYGRVSYPLYLWHWPALCFPILLGVPLSMEVRVLILLASVVLAALTHELVEKPIELLRRSRRRSMMLLASLAACTAIGAVVAATDGLRFTFPDELQSIAGLRRTAGH